MGCCIQSLTCVWLGDLYRRIKHQILLAILTSKLMHSFRFEIFNILKGSLALLKIQKAPLLQLEFNILKGNLALLKIQKAPLLQLEG